jgi:hypothetical protein
VQTEPVFFPPGLSGQTDGVVVDGTQTFTVVTMVIVAVILARPSLLGYFDDMTDIIIWSI